ncbi:MAG TPA: hypothetical protein VLW47_00615 [Thermodesulfobacteriota bacterium]|nr:hypothetical protein [Thermodesulfobacteriota bacterium]
MKKAVIIPIYLRLNEPGELPKAQGLALAKRAINSLKVVADQDFTLILPVCLDLGEKEEEAPWAELDGLLREEIKLLRKERTLIFSPLHLKHLRGYLGQKHFSNFSNLIGLKGFSKIRNTGLLLAEAFGMEVVVFLDNDEVVEDSNFLEIACEYLNKKWNGKVVAGKGGFYINSDGAILLPPQHLWWRFLWDKTKWMNCVWERILSSKERLVQSPMLLGGNLALHRDLFRRVPFDPRIPRGEDTDYLINASHLGLSLFFDKELRIKHLHPERSEIYFEEELKGDIERFLYERGKTKATAQMDLDPYPGRFLKWTLYPRAALTSFFLGVDYLVKGEWKKAGQCITNMRLLLQRQEGWSNYLEFRRDWERVMGEMQRAELNEILESCRV